MPTERMRLRVIIPVEVEGIPIPLGVYEGFETDSPGPAERRWDRLITYFLAFDDTIKRGSHDAKRIGGVDVSKQVADGSIILE